MKTKPFESGKITDSLGTPLPSAAYLSFQKAMHDNSYNLALEMLNDSHGAIDIETVDRHKKLPTQDELMIAQSIVLCFYEKKGSETWENTKEDQILLFDARLETFTKLWPGIYYKNFPKIPTVEK